MTSKKPQLLFIHGFRGSPSGLEQITEYFPDYDGFAPYIPPSGGEPLAKYDLKHYVDFLADYIKEHDLHKPVLIGHSMGAIIAAAMANRHPELVNRKLILLAPITKKVARPIAWLAPLMIILPRDLVSYIINSYLFVPRYDRYLYKATLEEAKEGAHYYTSRLDLAKAAKFSSSHTVDIFKLRQKTLIIAGEKDRIVPVKSTQKFAKKIGAKAVFIPGTGHLLNYENPKLVAKLIRGFLAK